MARLPRNLPGAGPRVSTNVPRFQNLISSQFDGLVKVANDFADKAGANFATELGEQLQTEAGTSEQVTFLPINRAGQIAQQAADNIFANQKEIELEQGLSEIKLQNLNDPEAFKKAADQFRQEWLKGVAASNVETFRRVAQKKQQRIFEGLQVDAVNALRRQNLADLFTQYDDVSTAFVDSVLAGDGDARIDDSGTTVGEHMDKLAVITRSMIDNGGDPVQIQRLMSATLKEVREAEITRVFRNAPGAADKQKFTKAILENDTATLREFGFDVGEATGLNLDNDERRALSRTLEQELTGQIASATKKRNRRIKDAIRQAQETGVIQHNIVDEVRAADGEETADELATLLHREQETYNTVQGIRFADLSTASAELETLRPEPGEADFNEKFDRYENAIKNYALSRKALEDDPISYIRRQKVGENLDTTAIVELQRNAGIQSPKIYTETEAKQLVSQIAQTEGDLARASAIENALAEFTDDPELKRFAYRQLVDEKLPDTTRNVLLFSHDPLIAEEVSAAYATDEKVVNDRFKARPAGSEELKQLKADVREGLTEFKDSVLGGRARVLRSSRRVAEYNRVEDAIIRTAKFLVTERNLTPDEAVDRVTKSFLEQYSFADTYRIPREVDADLVSLGTTSVLLRLSDFDLFVGSEDDPRVSDDSPIPESLRLDLEREQADYTRLVREKGVWVTNGDETGLVRVDELGRPVTHIDENGVRRNFELSWEDLIAEGLSARTNREVKREQSRQDIRERNKRLEQRLRDGTFGTGN